MIKRSIHQEDLTILYAPSIITLKYKVNTNRSKRSNRQQFNKSRNFSTPLSVMDTSSREKINKETLDLNTL